MVLPFHSATRRPSEAPLPLVCAPLEGVLMDSHCSAAAATEHLKLRLSRVWHRSGKNIWGSTAKTAAVERHGSL
jgi:hypothetical protein